MPDADPLDELRERVKATQEAAERVMRDVPPSGWAAPPPAAGAATSEVQALVGLLESLRDLLPPALAGHRAAGATLRDGALEVTFTGG